MLNPASEKAHAREQNISPHTQLEWQGGGEGGRKQNYYSSDSAE